LANYKTLDDFDVKNKFVLVRVDINSEINPETKNVASDVRIRVHAERTIRELSDKGAKVVVLAHQGRRGDPDFTSLEQHATIISKILNKPVNFVDDVFGEKAKNAIKDLQSGQILLLDNVRSFSNETKEGTPIQHSSTELVQNLAPLMDLFVNDAFAAAHRAHVSIVGFTAVLPSAAGRVMERELVSLSKAVGEAAHPCVYIVGGAKSDDALDISKHVLTKGIADYILTGGVTAQLFLTAQGYDLGKPNMSLINQKDFAKFIPGIKELLKKYPGKIIVPQDLAITVDGVRKEINISDLPTEYPIFDIGTKAIEDYSKIVALAKSIEISGPMGVYEKPEFAIGTSKVFQAVADNTNAFSLAGGGHTISSIHKFGLSKKISYVSTAGGALVEFLMGKKLPGVAALETASTSKLI